MNANSRWFVCLCFCTVMLAQMSRGQTVETNTFADINLMATMWEANPSQITSLVNTQYPAYNGNTWQYIFPVNTIESDGDIHIDMAVNSSGSGKTGNNNGESPVICEVINASSAQLSHVTSISGSQSLPVGIFRFYTEHTGERHFEIHPMTQLLKWNASSNAFLLDTDYHVNLTNDPNATTHATSTLQEVFNGVDRMIATVMPDNNHLIFTWQSPSVNYVQYGGIAMSGLTNDSVSSFFWFQPTNPSFNPAVTARCRIITNTAAAALAAGLVSNQTLTVNALTRTDMLVVSNTIAGMTSGQSTNVARPVELITLGILSVGTPPAPVAAFSGSPTNGTAPLTVTFTDTSTGSITNRFWDFGDTISTNITTNSVVHAYAAGTYNVKLIVSGLGASATNSKPSYIVATSGSPPPVAIFSGSPTNGTEPLLVTFTDTSTGTITNRFWDFGDTSTTNVTTNSVVHSYAAGSYTVSLTVSGPGGTNTSAQLNYINVLTAFQAWQVQYFGSTTNPAAAASADPDGDGFSNLQEYLAGIDPTNSASTFAITSILQQGSDFLITWTMGSGKTNALQLSLGDGNGNYSNNFTDLFSVTNTVGTVTNYLDAGAVTNPPPRFYRVRLVP